MKSFKKLSEEVQAETEVLEGKVKIIKTVKDSKGKFKKIKTFKCDGGKKYNPHSKKCEIISGSEKASMKKASKKRSITLNKKTDASKAKDAKLKAKANKKFGL